MNKRLHFVDQSSGSRNSFLSSSPPLPQGPEWVWLTGFYVRALLIMSQRLIEMDPSMAHIRAQAVREGQEILLRLNNHLRTSPWRSLPELTQANGEVGIAFPIVFNMKKTSLNSAFFSLFLVLSRQLSFTGVERWHSH